jgi:CCR4-NOT complex subunit CAF16
MIPAISVRAFSFAYSRSPSIALRDVSFELQPGARCLLAGANGAGKTTLLRVLAGKHMVPTDAVRVLGRPAFDDTSLAADVEYLGGLFPFDVDIAVGQLVDGVIGVDPGRRELLVRVLGVDLAWHMHAVSDGQRKRVQILLGLLRPSRVLLLDEITTDLDLLARRDLLAFLRAESEQHATTIVYASHILDRLELWSTHLAYMAHGRMQLVQAAAEVTALQELVAAGAPSPMAQLIESWLERDSRATVPG